MFTNLTQPSGLNKAFRCSFLTLLRIRSTFLNQSVRYIADGLLGPGERQGEGTGNL